MAAECEAGVPQSPETQSPDVREQLHQDQVSHEGTTRTGAQTWPDAATHMGAVDTEVTPIMPIMRGPSDLVGEEESGDDLIDPADEITPG